MSIFPSKERRKEMGEKVKEIAFLTLIVEIMIVLAFALSVKYDIIKAEGEKLIIPVSAHEKEAPFAALDEKGQDVVKKDHVDEIARKVIATTYNAEIAQTDSDPYTMANGERVNEQAVASNCYKLGTKIEIEGKIYKVSDRMNKRFTPLCGTENERIDIFKWDKKDNFKKSLTINIL